MSEGIKEKIRQTNLERYGCENPLGSDLVKEKIARTKYENGTQNSSKQQNYFHDILGGKLNYPFKHYYIDIAFPNDKIAVEYNGGGHDLSVKLGNITESKFKQLETFRKKQLYADG